MNFYEKAFRLPFRWLLRKRQSKGYGIHSPFAFNLITGTLHSPHRFYAFSDIREILLQNGFAPDPSAAGFNQLTFRLIHRFQAQNILEINSGSGTNTLFLTAPSSHIRCTCVEEDGKKVAAAERLRKQTGRQWKTVSTLSGCEGERYDAIVVDLRGSLIPDISTLTALSHPDTFWVFHPVKRGAGKQFWNKIVHDERVRITFDAKETGIVFPKPGFHKKNYLV
ncbi:MAG: hypothetical protein LBH72_04060 [Proteiniphilum sp.]|jgi:hypothetical protein|nr:hypothetical protein [Proteiniphilum sp.]